MDLNIITIAAAAVSAILAAVSLYRSNDVKTRSDEVALLRAEVQRLHKQQAEQEKKIEDLRSENALLYHVLRKLGVDVEAEIAALRDGEK